jgi:hypothetical protein
MVDALAPPDAFENLGFLVLSARRNQTRDGFADDFPGSISEYSLLAAADLARRWTMWSYITPMLLVIKSSIR